MSNPAQGVIMRPGFAEMTPVAYNGPPPQPRAARPVPVSGPPPPFYAADELGALWVDENGYNMMSE
jgi:hypothetical protein